MRRSVSAVPRQVRGRGRAPFGSPFTRRPPLEVFGRASRARGGRMRASPFSIASIASIFSILSLRSAGSILSIGSIGSVLSIGSAGSILSIGSAGSILCIGSAGGILRIGGRRAVPDRAAQAPQPLAAPPAPVSDVRAAQLPVSPEI